MPGIKREKLGGAVLVSDTNQVERIGLITEGKNTRLFGDSTIESSQKKVNGVRERAHD